MHSPSARKPAPDGSRQPDGSLQPDGARQPDVGGARVGSGSDGVAAAPDGSLQSEAGSGRVGSGSDGVFTFFYVSWQAAAQRGWFMPEDRLARMLVEDEGLGRVLVCDPMRSLPAKLVRDRLSRDAVVFPAADRARLLRPVRLRRKYPTSLGGVERACAAYERALRRGAQRMGLEDPVVITTNPMLAGFGELSWARAVTFYATDDWSAYQPHRRWWPAYRESFRRVAAHGRRVAAVSDAILERVAPSGPSVVIANGLEPSEWLGRPEPPAWVQGLRRPLLVYAGSLGSRLDVDALLAIARAQPTATLLLVGPLAEPHHIAPLRQAANIEIRPSLGRREVTGLIRCADVGLIPHLESPLTRAMSPLKLYEYLAAGLPVLATDLPPMHGVAPERVTLVPQGGDFVEGIRLALALGRAPEVERVAFVEHNSWRHRHERLLDFALA